MQQQDAFLSHVISQTLASLSFLQSQNVLYASPELDQVRSQLSSRQNGSSDAGPSNAGAITYNAVPSQAQTYPSSSASSAIVPSLPPRRVDSSNSQNVPNRAVAMWNYDSSAQGDLAFRKDDVIIIDEEVNAEWYRGHPEADPSRSGLFPHNYVRKLQPGELMNTGPYAPGPSYAQHNNNNTYSSPQIQPQPQQMAPYQPPPQQMMYQQPYQTPFTPHPPAVPMAGQVVETTDSKGRKKFKIPTTGMGNTLAHSAVGGLGFGAGSAVAENIVNAILH